MNDFVFKEGQGLKASMAVHFYLQLPGLNIQTYNIFCSVR